MRRLLLLSALAAAVLPGCRKIVVNNPPEAPAITERPGSGSYDTAYRFIAAASDADSEAVFVRFDWGDGDTSGWSASPDTALHSWLWGDRFVVRAQAKDERGALSDWSAACTVAIAGPPPFPCVIVDTVGLPSPPQLLALTPDGSYLYVALGGADSVAVVRVEDKTVVALIPIPDLRYWIDFCVLPSGQYVYAVGRATNECHLYGIRTADNALVLDMALPPDLLASRLAPLPGSNYIFLTEDGDYDTLLALRVSDNTLVGRTRIAGGTSGIAPSPDGAYVYALGWTYADMYVVRTADFQEVGTISLGYSEPLDLMVSPDGTRAWVLHKRGMLCANLQERSIELDQRLPTEKNRMDSMPGGDYFYLTGWDGEGISVVRRPALRFQAEIRMGSPSDCAFTADGRSVFVADYGSAGLVELGLPGAARAAKLLPRALLKRGAQ